jgi:hypothetical protein
MFGLKGINNLLEFLGMTENIWLSCLESSGDEHCILAIGDNTSAIGWLHNWSRLDTKWDAHAVHLKVARKIAMLLINFRCCLVSQHLIGNSTWWPTSHPSPAETRGGRLTRSQRTYPPTMN